MWLKVLFNQYTWPLTTKFELWYYWYLWQVTNHLSLPPSSWSVTITSPTAMTSQLAFQLLSLLTPTLHLVFSHNQVTQLNKLNLITSCSTFCSGSCFTRRKATIFIMVCNTIFHPVTSPLTSSLSTALLATLSPCLTSGTFLPWCLCTGCFICQENSCPDSFMANPLILPILIQISPFQWELP